MVSAERPNVLFFVSEDYIDYRGVRNSNFNHTFSIEDYAREAQTIFENAQAENKPFLAIINYSDAHRKFIETSKAGYPTIHVTSDVDPLPWIGLDTPRLREETRNYLSCMNRLDEGIGMVLTDLDRIKLRNNTLIIYVADHGADFPRGKTSCQAPHDGNSFIPSARERPPIRSF